MVKAIMNYTIEDMREYCKVIQGDKGILGFFTGVVLIYTIAVIIFAIVGTPLYSLVIMCIVWAVIAALFVLSILDSKKTPEKEFEKFKKKYNGKPVHFEFDFNKLTADTKDGIESVYNSCDYANLEYAIETHDYFYFSTNENEKFILKKTAVKEGTVSDLEDILKNHLHSKLIIK